MPRDFMPTNRFSTRSSRPTPCFPPSSFSRVRIAAGLADYVVDTSTLALAPLESQVIHCATALRRPVPLAELAAEKERLAVTLRSIGDAVITTDREGCIVLLNRVAEELTGWPEAERSWPGKIARANRLGVNIATQERFMRMPS